MPRAPPPTTPTMAPRAGSRLRRRQEDRGSRVEGRLQEQTMSRVSATRASRNPRTLRQAALHFARHQLNKRLGSEFVDGDRRRSTEIDGADVSWRTESGSSTFYGNAKVCTSETEGFRRVGETKLAELLPLNLRRSSCMEPAALVVKRGRRRPKRAHRPGPRRPLLHRELSDGAYTHVWFKTKCSRIW